MTLPGARGQIVQLRDRSAVLLRPIAASDRAELAAGFERFSPASRYQRFLSAKQRLGPAELAYLTDIDHRDHEAVVAVDPGSGRGLGVARFVRLPSEPDAAEVAVAVADDWQRRGLGTVLLRRLVERARHEGVRRFRAELLADNRGMVRLLEDLGVARVRDREGGWAEYEVELPESGLGPALQTTLRAVAGGDMRFEIRPMAGRLDGEASAAPAGTARQRHARGPGD